MSDVSAPYPKPVDLTQYLVQLAADGPIHFRANAGNAGDSLIACATYQIFDRLGLDYRLISERDFDPAGKVVVCGGGGAFLANGSPLVNRIRAWHRAAKRLVVLPHTYCGNESLLAELGSNVDLFVRERVSYDHLRLHLREARLMMGHDLAFSIDVAAASQPGVRVWHEGFAPKRLVRRYGWFLRQKLRRRQSDQARVLNCLRTDSERTEIRLPRDNVDLSKLFKCGGQSPALAARSARMTLTTLDQYDEIVTNRLHMAIAGALLGKRVRFHPNSYHKCHSVYEYSLKERFPNVQWMG